MKNRIIAVIVVLALCGGVLLMVYYGHKQAEAQRGDIKPHVMYNDVLYEDEGHEFEDLEYTRVSVVRTSVDEDKLPTENNQTNFGCVGCGIYTAEGMDGYVFVFSSGHYWAYRRV
jgi:hypothetical protein